MMRHCTRLAIGTDGISDWRFSKASMPAEDEELELAAFAAPARVLYPLSSVRKPERQFERAGARGERRWAGLLQLLCAMIASSTKRLHVTAHAPVPVSNIEHADMLPLRIATPP